MWKHREIAAETEKSAQQKVSTTQWHHGHYKSIFKAIIEINMQNDEKEVKRDTKRSKYV